jgi:hypothetical protein
MEVHLTQINQIGILKDIMIKDIIMIQLEDILILMDHTMIVKEIILKVRVDFMMIMAILMMDMEVTMMKMDNTSRYIIFIILIYLSIIKITLNLIIFLAKVYFNNNSIYLLEFTIKYKL